MNTLDAGRIHQPISVASGARLDRLEVFAEIESTNSYLLDQPAPPAGRFRVALADHQTAGRGRQDRSWQSPPSSGLCLSVAYTFERVPDKLPGLTLGLGVGVVEALNGFGIDGIRLKWPNDIIALDRKLGGILTEARNGRDRSITVVAGVGLNVDLPDSMKLVVGPSFRNGVVDLKECTDSLPSREDLAIAAIERLFDCMLKFDCDGFAPFRDGWRKYDWLYGKKVVVDQPNRRVTGTADGLDNDAALVILGDGERHRVITGTVTVLTDPEIEP